MTKREELETLTLTLRNAAVTAGLTDEASAARWGVDVGSKTYGRAFRLYQFGADTVAPQHGDERYPFGTGHYSAAGLPDYLGMTHAECVRSLRMIIETLSAINYK